MNITRNKILIFIAIVFVIIFAIIVNYPLYADTTLTEVDYLDIAYDLYFHPDDCEGQKIIARGLWYFIGGGEAIGNEQDLEHYYTNIEDYYIAGLDWLKLACPSTEELLNG